MPVGKCVDRHLGRHAAVYPDDVPLNNVDNHAKRAQVDDVQDSGVGGHEGAGMDKSFPNKSRHRGVTARVFQIELVLIQAGLGLPCLSFAELQLGLCRLLPRYEVIQILSRDQLFFEQVPIPCNLAIEIGQFRFPLLDGSS
jgi:hypothetical protein